MVSRRYKRGKQFEYNQILDAFNAHQKRFADCVEHLVNIGFSLSQSNNAVHVYFKGGDTEAHFRLSSAKRTKLLDGFDAKSKPPKASVKYLMKLGCTYRQATSAVYKYRQERGLISTKLT